MPLRQNSERLRAGLRGATEPVGPGTERRLCGLSASILVRDRAKDRSLHDYQAAIGRRWDSIERVLLVGQL